MELLSKNKETSVKNPFSLNNQSVSVDYERHEIMKDSGSTTKNLTSGVTRNLMQNQQSASTENPVRNKQNEPTSNNLIKNAEELIKRTTLLGIKGVFFIDDRRDFWPEYEEGIRAARERRDQKMAEIDRWLKSIPEGAGYKVSPRNKDSDCDSNFKLTPSEEEKSNGEGSDATMSKKDENAIRKLLSSYRTREERKELALRFRSPDDLNVKPLKDAISKLIFDRTGIRICEFRAVDDPGDFKYLLMTRDGNASEVRSINREEVQKMYKEFSDCVSLGLHQHSRIIHTGPYYFACTGMSYFISEVEKNLQR